MSMHTLSNPRAVVHQAQVSSLKSARCIAQRFESEKRSEYPMQVAWLLSGVYFGLVPAGPLLFGRSDEASALVFGERHPYSVHKGAAFASVVHSCYDYEAVV